MPTCECGCSQFCWFAGRYICNKCGRSQVPAVKTSKQKFPGFINAIERIGFKLLFMRDVDASQIGGFAR